MGLSDADVDSTQDRGTAASALTSALRAAWYGRMDPGSTWNALRSGLVEALIGAGFHDAEEALSLYLGAWEGTMPFGRFLERLLRLLRFEGLLEELDSLQELVARDLDDLLTDAARRKHPTDGQPGRWEQPRSRTITPEDSWIGSQAERVLLEAVRSALVADSGNPILRRNAPLLLPGVVPHVGRREAALLAAGVFPTFYSRPVLGEGIKDERVALFLDVSGSMGSMLAVVTGLVLGLGPLLGREVYAFSNRVVPTTLEAFRRGEIHTTGGTDLDCVAQFAAQAGMRRILVVTDGLVDCDEGAAAIFRRMDTYLLIVTSAARGYEDTGYWEDLESIARRTWVAAL